MLKLNLKKTDEIENYPDWGLQTGTTTSKQASEAEDNSSDSGLDSNEKILNKNRRSSLTGSQSKIAEGKIIFSFLPQIIPISMETLDENKQVSSRIESAFESIQSAWALLASMQTARALLDTTECDRTAKTIQLAFASLGKLLLALDSDDFRLFNAYKSGTQNLKIQNY